MPKLSQPRGGATPASNRPERIEAGGARGVQRDDVGASATQASAARTRTMDAGGVRAFSASDYQAPEGAPGAAQTQASAVDAARLGRAEGVSSLRQGHLSRSQEGRAKAAEVRRDKMLPVAVVMIAVVVAIGVGAFFLFRSALSSVNESATSAQSAHYATDAYVLMAVRSDDGALSSAYLGYVDSINGRTELCLLPADIEATMPSGEQAGTLASAFADGGLDRLASSVGSLGNIELAASFVVTPAQMDAIIDVATNASSSQDVAGLAGTVAAEPGQNVTEAALRGLLVTMHDVGSEGYVEMTAPTTQDDSAAKELLVDDWQTMVRGMRDAASDVTLAG